MPPLLAFPPEVINPIFRDGIDDNELEPIAVEVTTSLGLAFSVERFELPDMDIPQLASSEPTDKNHGWAS